MFPMHTQDNLRDHEREVRRGAEKRRLRPADLLARFEEVRRGEQLDESAADMLKRAYI